MRYMFLIYESESAPARESADLGPAYTAFTEAVRQIGVLVASDALELTSSATTVRVRKDKTVTTDGPFAETKEQLGGYYILDCATFDEALEYAAKIPSARFGSVEVRPIAEVPPALRANMDR
jgi:hypothetical protein